MPDDSKRRLVADLARDLADETRELTAVLDGLDAVGWDRPTPAEGWNVRDQVTHLAFFDDATLLSLRDPDGFAAMRAEHQALGDGFPDIVAERHRHLSGADARSWLERSRSALVEEYRAADPGARLPWYGPGMGVPSSVTARLMETWAHGQDIRDTVGAETAVTPRLRHIANLGVRTFGFCFGQRNLPVPSEPVFVELDGPGEETWTWGPGDAANRVTGAALDFCLVVTQRRSAADTGLAVTGPVAERWIAIAQAFAGRPTDPPSPGSPGGVLHLLCSWFMSVGFRPTAEDLSVIEANRREGENTSDVIRRALRLLDREAWEERARRDTSDPRGGLPH